MTTDHLVYCFTSDVISVMEWRQMQESFPQNAVENYVKGYFENMA
jgi:hypothetical protein